MENIKLVAQAHRDYETFKKAIGILTKKINLSEEEEANQYALAKARLYNIDLSNFSNDFTSLQQQIDEQEFKKVLKTTEDQFTI